MSLKWFDELLNRRQPEEEQEEEPPQEEEPTELKKSHLPEYSTTLRSVKP